MDNDRQRRIFAIIGSLFFLFIAPFTVAGIVPYWINQWKVAAHLPILFHSVGVIVIIVGVTVLVDSFARFALQGLGTPAPVFPTRHLVVKGLYRYVRNPMYVTVEAVILGQSLLFGDLRLLEYGALVWLCFHVFVRLYEEPKLRTTFGHEYETYCKHVPRCSRVFTHGPRQDDHCGCPPAVKVFGLRIFLFAPFPLWIVSNSEGSVRLAGWWNSSSKLCYSKYLWYVALTGERPRD